MPTQRLLAAAILIPLVVTAVLSLSTQWLALLLTPVILLAANEYLNLAGAMSLLNRLSYLCCTLLLLLFCWWLLTQTSWSIVIFFFSLFVWSIIAFEIWSWRQQPFPWKIPIWLELLLGLFALSSAWLALLWLHRQQGPELTLLFLVLIWVADSAAYFAGRLWGHSKLAPAISPGKTWQGVYGAFVGALICAFLWSWWQEYYPIKTLLLAVLFLSVTSFSIVGDLLESLLKRQSGLKDSGKLIPGHGGLLDRIDSLLAAAPLFAFGIAFFGVS